MKKIIDRFCTDYSLLKPRMYRREARIKSEKPFENNWAILNATSDI
jgi:hypothetical protein